MPDFKTIDTGRARLRVAVEGVAYFDFFRAVYFEAHQSAVSAELMARL